MKLRRLCIALAMTLCLTVFAGCAAGGTKDRDKAKATQITIATETTVTEVETTAAETEKATVKPTVKPTEKPTQKPTEKPTQKPTRKPTQKPTDPPQPVAYNEPGFNDNDNEGYEPDSGSTYVLNTNTKKFHYPYCSSVDKIAARNREDFSGSREDAISMGYSPCKRCNP